MELFSSTFQSLENALNYSNTKQKVISQNIANSDTPNYKAKEVDKTQSFKAELGSFLKSYRTDERHYTFKSEGVMLLPSYFRKMSNITITEIVWTLIRK